MTEEKSTMFNSGRRSFRRTLLFKTLTPLVVIILLMICLFGTYLSTTSKNKSKEFIVEDLLVPEFGLLAKEKDNEFKNVVAMTEATAKKIEDKIHDSKKRTSDEVDAAFNGYLSKKPDGSYRSSLDESKGRYQMAAFINNKTELDFRHKGIFVDAFSSFDPFAESMLPFVFTTYFASANSIWQYGFPDWALTSPADESFGVYNWFTDADPVKNPNRGHVWTEMYYDGLQGQWMISSLMPIYDGDEFLGIVGQDLVLGKIMEITKRSAAGNTGFLFFIDNLGNIVAHPDTAQLINKDVKNDEKLNLTALPDVPMTNALRQLPADEPGHIFTEETNRRIVMQFPLESVHWRMVYVVTEDEILKVVDQTNKQVIITFIVFAFALLIAAVLLLKTVVTDPIKELTKTATKMSKGKLDGEIRVRSNDEIGELATAFSQMTTDLGRYEKTLETQVTDRTKQLNEKIEQLEKLNKLTVGRELKMMELKKKIKELEGTRR